MKKDALSVAKELVKILEELHEKNLVMLADLKPGDKFSTGIGNFIVLEQKEDCAVIITEKLFIILMKILRNGLTDVLLIIRTIRDYLLEIKWHRFMHC